MIEEGEVYEDNIFDEEMKIISIDGDKVTVEDSVGDSEERSIELWRIEHNISANRYRRIRKEDVDVNIAEEKKPKTIFDY